MEQEIVNKVANSSLVQLDLEDYYPKEEIVVFDLRKHLFMELILKEKDFRNDLQNMDWQPYENKIVAVTCSADAIVPAWAYMLVASYLQPLAREVIFGTIEDAIKQVLLKRINAIDTGEFADKRVVVKGCGDVQIGEYAYMEIALKLRPVVKSIMYGEPCSTVPVYKAKSKA